MQPSTSNADEPPAEPAPAPLLARARTGALWSLVFFGSGQLLRFASNLVLTRILDREAFGLMTLVNVLIMALQLFSDVGLGPSVVQHARGGDRVFLGTAYTIQAIRGVGLALGAAVLAYPFARFYGEPRLTLLVMAVGLSSVASGLVSMRLLLASRNLAVRQAAGFELGATAIGIACTIATAFALRSVWALVLGTLAQHAARLVLSHVLLPGPRDRFGWNGAVARELFSFGRWVFVGTLFAFLAGQSDRLILGKLIPIGLLGLYGIAATLATIPEQALSQVASSVFFPLYSRVHAEGGDLPTVFRNTRRVFAMVAGWALSGLIAGGPTIVRMLYDARYADAGWMVQAVSAGVWLVCLTGLNGAALLATGKPKLSAVGAAAKFLGLTALVPLGHRLFGLPGAIWAVAVAELFRYATSAYFTARDGRRCVLDDLVTTTFLVAVSAAVWWFAARMAGRVPVAVEAAFVAAAVTLAWLPVAWKPVRGFLAHRSA